MAKKEHVAHEPKTLDALLVDSGINPVQAKASLGRLKAAFSAGVGGIPDGALSAWVNENFSGNTFWMAVGRSWEKEV